MADINNIPWKYLDDFRGTEFTGEWPTFPELLRIQTKRNGERPCFTAFDDRRGRCSAHRQGPRARAF